MHHRLAILNAGGNLHRRDADIVLRMTKPERGHVSVQRVGTLGCGLYGAQSYMEGRAGGPEVGLERDELIAWAEGYGHLPATQWIDVCFTVGHRRS